MINFESYDPTTDPMVMALAKTLVQRGRWAKPDVLVESDPLPTEIGHVFPLFARRIDEQAGRAVRDAGPLVETVVAGVAIIGNDAFHVPPAGPADLKEARASRTRAERIAHARRILDAAAQVETTTEVHRRAVDALRRAAVEAADHLHGVFRLNHRHADEFTFVVPGFLHVGPEVYEIGLARVRAALGQDNKHPNTEEGAA